MTIETLEGRVERLEKIVGELLRERASNGREEMDWRSTIGMFDDDPIMKQVIDGALQARQEEREQFYQEFDRMSDGQ